MTGNDIITYLSQNPAVPIAVLGGVPAFTGLLGLGLSPGAGSRSPTRYVYSVLVYAACIPGILATALIAYTLFFTRESLLDKSLVVYALPLASMIATLALIARRVSFDDLPGFDRLSGLMLLLGGTFVAIFLLSRTRVWIFFGGSMSWLIGLTVATFLLLRVAASMAFGRRP